MHFSVIIPLEFHRGQGTRCVRAWCKGQDLPAHEFEVIAVMPRHYPSAERRAIEVALRPNDRLVMSDNAHDMAHCVEGAAISRGKNLFFTESHVWPEPTVLSACLAVLEQEPYWAAFSCKSERITPNLLAEVEADMYERDIDYAMHVHPWRKILDQCFVTRKRDYCLAGGFDASLGHFAEWALAEKYCWNKAYIGYAPHIRLHHYYIGKISELREFTQGFVQGEICYHATGTRDSLIEAPSEWLVRGDFHRGRTRSLVRTLWMACFRDGGQKSDFKLHASLIVRCLPIAAGLPNLLRTRGLLHRLWCRMRLSVALQTRSRKRVTYWFSAYLRAIVDDERRKHISRLAKSACEAFPERAIVFSEPSSATSITGFFPIETVAGQAFRWSQSSAAVDIKVPKGKSQLRLHCVKVPKRLRENIVFFFNDRQLLQEDVLWSNNKIELSIDSRSGGVSRLSWICPPWREPGTKRRLGLPVVRLSVE